MTRLLFAAARGARIGFALSGKWNPALSLTHLQSKCGQDAYRIHPDDEHLAYGPISTALREFADTGVEPHTLIGLMAMGAYFYECEYRTAEWPHAQMFALILAEALADEGM